MAFDPIPIISFINLITELPDEDVHMKKFRHIKHLRVVSRKEAKERNAARLMRKAAQVLKDKDWTRHTQLGANGEMCILGALNYAYCGNARPKNRNALVELTNNMFVRWNGLNIPVFNDNHAKDKQEILETMLKFSNEFDPQGDSNE